PRGPTAGQGRARAGERIDRGLRDRGRGPRRRRRPLADRTRAAATWPGSPRVPVDRRDRRRRVGGRPLLKGWRRRFFVKLHGRRARAVAAGRANRVTPGHVRNMTTWITHGSSPRARAGRKTRPRRSFTWKPQGARMRSFSPLRSRGGFSFGVTFVPV